jgi:hypothetical protein
MTILCEYEQASVGGSVSESQLADRLAHDCRTPLTVIAEFASLLREGVAGPLTARQDDMLNIISTRVEDLNLLLDDFADLCRVQSGQSRTERQEHRIEALCEEVWPAIQRRAAQRGVQVACSFAADLPAVFVDRLTASRALFNLTVEAMRLLSKGETLTLWAAPAGLIAVRVVPAAQCPPNFSGPEALEPAQSELPPSCDPTTASFGMKLAEELASLNWGSLQRCQASAGVGSVALELPRFDARLIIGETVRHWRTDGALPQWMSLVAIQFSFVVDTAMASAIDTVLRRALHRHDILLRDTADQWLLIARRDPIELDRLFRAVLRHWRDERLLDDAGELPQPFLTAMGSWKLQPEDDHVIEEIWGARDALASLAH